MFRLSKYSSMASVVKDLRHWKLVSQRLATMKMPPKDAKLQPSTKQRKQIIDWIQTLQRLEAQRNSGDPGSVLPRRLSNSEYDYTIRDLTGVDIRPTREFPIDPANEAGFDNSGESLSMSPALMRKYLAAARQIADHIVLKPAGFDFATHLMVADTDRDKYCVKRIIDFYKRHRIDYADYFMAAWRFRHRKVLDKQPATLADFAKEAGISSRYLTTIWSILENDKFDAGPIATLRGLWQKLPVANGKRENAARAGCEQMRDFVVRQRRQFSASIQNVSVNGISKGSQTLILWKNRKLAENRMRYMGRKTNDALSPSERMARERFCAVFPDTFFVSERGRMFLAENKRNKGRLLSSGFHLMLGYFRDDKPLYDLILNERGQRELDKLWQELNFVTSAPLRQYKDFVFFERAEPPRFAEGAEFDFARSEDKNVASQAKLNRFATTYIAKARKNGARGDSLRAIQQYFANIEAEIRWVEQTRAAAQPSHVRALLAFAGRAFRRPLTKSERDSVLDFYRSLREEDGLSHEDAIRDSIVSLLMSPHFCYRIDLPSAGRNAQPITDFALASRLSYFLWSSMPDAELLGHAAAGDLHQKEVLIAQTRRMLGDARIRGLATEFGGNWLDFRRFEKHNSVDRKRFPSFTDELRQAMFEEPIRFFIDLVHHDRSILEFLYAEHTFVNPVLAKHYGIPSSTSQTKGWWRVANAKQYGRGGLLPMSVFLTKNSPGLRTSPVKRGYWVVRRVLGEHIPPPPPNVPELPKDEAELGNLTLRALLAKHRETASCAACHDRFDSLGLAFEAFGPIGERRSKDLGQKPIDNRATFPDGKAGTGVDGVRQYLREKREAEFVNNLCRKLFAYALGRSLALSDEAELAEMRTQLTQKHDRFSNIVETIVTSPQFLNRRGRDYERDLR
jgi:hypothetical protein